MNKPVRQLVPGEKVQPGDVLLDVNGDTQEVSIKSCDYYSKGDELVYLAGYVVKDGEIFFRYNKAGVPDPDFS